MSKPNLSPPKDDKTAQYFETPFAPYFRYLDRIDKGKKYTTEYGSIMIISLVEEIGEMARAYLAEHGRKKSNIAAQLDETYQQELGDILLTILRFARIKNIDLHERLTYSLQKIEKRKLQPKEAKELK
jgi:NTP pyrophosphatase (non-canonical NTP hydrolase)